MELAETDSGSSELTDWLSLGGGGGVGGDGVSAAALPALPPPVPAARIVVAHLLLLLGLEAPLVPPTEVITVNFGEQC